jgi:tripartite-type tricarboxylate transporter receptor subunit TctC
VPTVADTIPGFEASSWFGLVAPAKTPAPALAKLSGELETILKMPDVKKRLAELGAEPGTVFGDAFGQFMTDETAKWGKLVKASGATVD